MHARVAITAIEPWKPNVRIGSSSLMTSEKSPIAVVPAESRQGSQPSRTARVATPRPPPSASASTR